MPRHYESTEALCPYYRGEEAMTIFCEGVAPGCIIHLAFGRNAAEYKKAYCRGGWERCRLAKMLTEIVEDQNGT